MASHLGRIEAPVMIGVGAAFDFQQARSARHRSGMQRNGLESLVTARRIGMSYSKTVGGTILMRFPDEAAARRVTTNYHDGRLINRADPFIQIFFVGFCVVLAGYAAFGKGFAYLGVPPVFIGDVTLFVGGIAALTSRCLRTAIVSSGPGLALIPLIGWVTLRTIPYIETDGIDAVRDSMIVTYSFFAFVTAAVLIAKPDRISAMFNFYNRFIPYFVSLSLALFIFTTLLDDPLKLEWPISRQPLFQVKSGDQLVQFAGVILIGLIGFRRFNPLLLAGIVAGVFMHATQNRGGFLALFGAVVLALWFLRATIKLWRLVAIISVVSVTVVTFLALFSVELKTTRIGSSGAESGRSISVRQITANILSIVGLGETDSDGEGTKEWRLEWWRLILNYTFFGDYFWTGKGFGVNLADADGFQIWTVEDDLPFLRSPHNSIMTIIARAGVPGLALWLLVLGSWAVTVLKELCAARKNGDAAWHSFFIFVFCWWMAFVINSSFDVALEGPMAGIWFWALHGVGIAAVIIYRQRIRGMNEHLERA